MNLVTHSRAGWMVANSTSLERRERAAVAVAGVIPDLDSVGAGAEVLTRNTSHPLTWFSDYHHSLHNLPFAVLVAAVCFFVARRRWMTAALAFLAFHVHLLCDLLRARGPEGYQWPIPYLLPFSHAWSLSWEGQWALNAWPNFALTFVLLLVTFDLAWKRGFSPLEMVSPAADRAIATTLRARFSQARFSHSSVGEIQR